jgi:ETFB lysine methyltransferase
VEAARKSQAAEPPRGLAARFELATTRVSIAGRQFDLLRPRNIDDLISEEDFAIDERIPYWADCWPSARVLAEWIVGLSGEGRRLLELGCGIGLVSLAAAQAGFDVLATDYYADALAFTAANADRHALSRIDTRLVDWRKPPDDLGTFDVVVASDVLYEEPQAALIANVLSRALAADGIGWLSDPGRRDSQALVDHCQRFGLVARRVAKVPTEDAGANLAISVYEIQRA